MSLLASDDPFRDDGEGGVDDRGRSRSCFHADCVTPQHWLTCLSPRGANSAGRSLRLQGLPTQCWWMGHSRATSSGGLHQLKVPADQGRKVHLSGRMRLRTQHFCRRKVCQWSARSLGRFPGSSCSKVICINNSRAVLTVALLFLSLLVGKEVECFVFNGGELSHNHWSSVVDQRWVSRSDCNFNNHVLSALKEDEVEGEFGEDLDTGSILMEDLSWRVAKLRLEEQNRERFLKSKPRFLPYEECRKWVQAFGRWKTEKDWKEWISMGEKRNSYIPSRPDEYYGRLGQWISWQHFLLGDSDEDDKTSTNGKSKD